MNAFDFVLAGGALVALIGLPIMVLLRLKSAGGNDAERDGEGWLLRPSSATYWAAGFCLIPCLGVLMRWRAGQNEPDYAITNTGPAMGFGLAILGLAVAIWLVVRHRRRWVRFDRDGIQTAFGAWTWDALSGAELARKDEMSPAVLMVRFQDGGLVKVRADIVGRPRLMDAVRRQCDRRGVPYESAARRRKARAHA